MRQRTITQLIQTPNDLDYVEHFQALAQVNLEIKRGGATRDQLLRKAVLEMDVGNFQASSDAARAANDLDPKNAEAAYLEGVAEVLMAMVRAEALPAGPGAGGPAVLPRDASIRTCLRHAADAFGRAVRLNPRDQEAKDDLLAVSTLLMEHADEGDLRDALRTHVGP